LFRFRLVVLFPTHEDQLSPYDHIAEYCKR